MKNNLKSIAVVVATVAIAVANNLEISAANPISIQQKPQINSGNLRENLQVKLGALKLYPTTISGSVTVKFGAGTSQGNLQCKDLRVNLYRDSSIPGETSPGGFPLSAAPFSVSKKLTGNLNAGKCNYVIAADAQYIDRKAKLDFLGGGDNNDGAKLITIPSQPIQMDTQVTFYSTIIK
jgi:hypothetical protein